MRVGELKVLAKGVDTVHMSGKGVVRAAVWDQVDELRKAGELNESAEYCPLTPRPPLASSPSVRSRRPPKPRSTPRRAGPGPAQPCPGLGVIRSPLLLPRVGAGG
jgi:hypothetical protein